MPERIDIEMKIAKAEDPWHAGIEQLGAASTYACPECHGVLLQVEEGGRVRFRCHTGHAYSAESLLAAINERMEDALWNTVRAHRRGRPVHPPPVGTPAAAGSRTRRTVCRRGVAGEQPVRGRAPARDRARGAQGEFDRCTVDRYRPTVPVAVNAAEPKTDYR